MSTTVNILLLSNPTGTVSFQVFNTAIGYSKTISKQFITGVPTNANYVQIGASMAATQANLYNNLIAYEIDGNCNYENNAGSIEMVFNVIGDYTVTVFSPNVAFEIAPTLVDDVPPEVVNPFEMKDLSIEIIDTYENELPLIVEFTEKSAPKLKYDSGDTLLGIMMASQLSFNMMVTNGSDAYFKHLYTGDENRYLVKLLAIDDEENTQLLWQGFLLPDQYSEPYKGGVIFVEFTAIDMLSALKGKYFPRWYFENSLPVIEIIAGCLKYTGLNQNILVNPSLVPAALINDFSSINLDLSVYNENEKLQDCYKIIEEILKSNCLTIKSFKGFWIITGFSEKRNVASLYQQFDVDGLRTYDVELPSIVRNNIYSNDSVTFSLKTPFKEVNIDSNSKGNKNLFSDRVVSSLTDNYKSGYNPYLNYPAGSITFPYPYPNNHYDTNDFVDWENHNSLPFFFYREFYQLHFVYRFFEPGYGWDHYNVNEATALNNYYRCTEKPYLKANVLYTLQFDIEIIIFAPPGNFEGKLKRNDYDKLACFQLFVDNEEVLSNRPSFPFASLLKYSTSSRPSGIDPEGNDPQVAVLSLTYEFELVNSGLADFRLLAPIMSGNSAKFYDVRPKKLQIGVTDDYDFTENVNAIRSINFTEKLDYSMELSSTSDKSVKNNFGLARPTSPNYFYTVPKNVNPLQHDDLQVSPPSTVLEYKLQTFQVSNSLRTLLFARNKKNALFVEDADGLQRTFVSFYYQFINNITRIGYLLDFTGRPKKPKTYLKSTVLSGTDVLKYMNVVYAAENVENRDNWKIKDSENQDTFNKTVASLLHSVYSKPCYILEGMILNIVFPDEILKFNFDNVQRVFIPTRIDIDLFEGKTKITATEDVYEEVTDITYE